MRVVPLALAAILAFTACGRPPLRVSQDGQAIVIDLQSLGEYPADVARLRLIDASRNEVVWELKGRDGPQLGRFKLRIGENPVQVPDVRHGTYDVVTPVGRSTFALAPATRYVVEAWGSDSGLSAKRTAEFVTSKQ